MIAPPIIARTVIGFKHLAILDLDGRELGTIALGDAAPFIAAIVQALQSRYSGLAPLAPGTDKEADCYKPTPPST